MGHVVFTSDKTDDEGWALGLDDFQLKSLKRMLESFQKKRDPKAFGYEVLTKEPKGKI